MIRPPATLDSSMTSAPTSVRLEDLQRLIGCIDLTNLNDTCRAEDVEALCRSACTPAGPVAAVCVWPRFVPIAAGALLGTGIGVATVIAFPEGDLSDEEIVNEIVQAERDGANEIDVVIPWRAALSGDLSAVRSRVLLTRMARRHALIKVILETGELVDPELIEKVSRIAIEAGVDFLKTSTGKTPIGATPAAAWAMLSAISASGKDVGIKISGGVSTLNAALGYFDLCRDALDGLHARNFRIGTSGLLPELLRALGQSPDPRTPSTPGY